MYKNDEIYTRTVTMDNALRAAIAALATQSFIAANLHEEAYKYKGASAETIRSVYDEAKNLNTYPTTGSIRYINFMRMLKVLWNMSDFPSPGVLSHAHELDT